VSAEAAARCGRYLDELPLPAERKRALLEVAQAEPEPAHAMARLHQALGGSSRVGEHGVLASIRRRVEAAVPGLLPDDVGLADDGAAPLPTAPPIQRTPMAPNGWPGVRLTSLLGALVARLSGRATRAGDAVEAPVSPDGRQVTRTAIVRRTLFIVLALAQAGAFAYYMMTKVLPYHGEQPLELAILSLSTILFAWVSLGFWTALSGFVLQCAGGDRHAITRSARPGQAIPPTPARRSSCRSATRGWRASSRGCAPPTSPSRPPATWRTSTSSS
jgi:membrane glycosyltransferase